MQETMDLLIIDAQNAEKNEKLHIDATHSKKRKELEMSLTPCNYLVIPEVLPIYPCCYIRIKRYCKYYEFYPSKRHKKPTAILKSTG